MRKYEVSMKNKITISVALVMILSTMLACGAPVVKPAAATQEPAPTKNPQPKPLPTMLPVIPTETTAPTAAPVLSKAQIGYSRVTYLTYDPSVWQVEFKVGAGSAMSGQDVYDLIHIQFGCILHDNLGHGVPETWTSTQYLQQLGTIEYQVEKWVDTTTGEAVLVVYHYPPGNWENYRRIELVIDGNPDACISAAETVLGLSEADIIGN
jgi:hypothetical protein